MDRLMIAVVEPATEQVMAEVPRAGAEELDAAVERARLAFPAWRAVSPGDRAALLHRLADALAEHADDLATLEARNVGKPIADARGELEMVVQTYRYYAGAPERLLGQTIPVAGGVDMTFREPLGVVGLIVPWNFPLVIASWKVAPALAAGNTIVLKPAELTPLTALELERIALAAGLPEGVLNVVAGPGERRRPAPRRAPRCRQDRVHRVDRGRPWHRPGRGRDDQARDARAGRQVGQRDLCRRRHGAGRGRRAARGVRQRGPGLLRPLAHPRGAVRARRLPRGARARGARHAGGGPARPRDPDGPADLGRAARDGGVVRARRRSGRDPRERAGRPRVLVPADGAGSHVQQRPRRVRGDLRPGRLRDPLRGRARGGGDRERHHLRPLGLDLDARRRPRPARRARDRHRRAVDQLEQLGARHDAVRRFQAIGRGAGAGPRRARALHRREERLLRNRRRS